MLAKQFSFLCLQVALKFRQTTLVEKRPKYSIKKQYISKNFLQHSIVKRSLWSIF